MSKKAKNPNLKVRTYVQRHRVETLLLQKKFEVSQRKHFVNDKLKDVSINEKFTHKCNIYYIKNKTLFEADRKKSDYFELVSNRKAVANWRDLPEKIEIERILFGYDSDHVLFDYQGRPVPVIMRFNYIGTPFDNEHLDLEKAIKILKKHPDVKTVSEPLDIESYNATRERNQYIRVEMFPRPEIYEKFYKQVTRKKKGKIPEFWSIRLNQMFHDKYGPDKKNNHLGLYPDAVKKGK